MKICVVSDSHDRAPMLAAAVQAGRDAGAEAVIHCGDVIGAQTLKPLIALGLPVHVIHGNNLGDPFALNRMCAASGGLLNYYGPDAGITLGGRRIFMTHYPHIARAMACTADYDLVCCGHSHIAGVERQRNIKGSETWLINPGTVAGLNAPPTWLLADLSGFAFEIRELGL